MYDALPVRRFESRGELQPDALDFRLRHGNVRQFCVQRYGGNIFRHQEIGFALSIKIEDDRNIGMVELGESKSFCAKTLSHAWICKRVRRQDLQRDVAIETLIAGAVNNSH